MNVVNTQLPQLYYNYNECFSLFSTYCIFQCKNLGGGHNQHVVILGGMCPWCPIGSSATANNNRSLLPNMKRTMLLKIIWQLVHLTHLRIKTSLTIWCYTCSTNKNTLHGLLMSEFTATKISKLRQRDET